MKKLTKNFIAFTLSEMMIVLLILSVISAATLPAITQRNEVKPRITSSKWSYYAFYKSAYGGVRGYFYKAATNSDSSDVIIGFPYLEAATAAQKTALINANKNAALRLVRPSYILKKVTDNASSIAFFSNGGVYQGKIAADSSGNLAIGKDVVKDPLVNNSGSFSTIIGNGAAMNRKGRLLRNIVVGYKAGGVNTSGLYSVLAQDNIVIGSNTTATPLNSNNIVIGSYASTISGGTASSSNSDNLIAIGSYSFAFGTYSDSNIGVGYFAGASGSGNNSKNNIMLGAYAGYRRAFNNNYSAIDIGYKSGMGANQEEAYDDSIDIGSFASYGSIYDGINIGYYANYQTNGSANYNSINIGSYAGTSTMNDDGAYQSINIGQYAGRGSYNEEQINIGVSAGVDTRSDSRSFQNVLIGHYAGFNNDLEHGVAIGSYAGYISGYHTTTAIYIGRYAGYASQSGNTDLGDVIIGCYGLTNLSGAKKMCIGSVYPGDKGGFNKTGNTVSTMITPYYSSSTWTSTGIYLLAQNVVSYGGSLTALSDRTLKENIVKTKYGIDKIRQVNIYQYNFKGEKDTKIGVIAQELQKIYPEAVSKANSKYLTVNSDWIIYSMVQALKDVDNAVMNLQNELNVNTRFIKKLSVRVNTVENKLDKLSDRNKDNKKLLAEIDVILSKMERK